MKMNEIATYADGLGADPAPFRAWLSGKPAGEVVGLSRRSCECPIAQYLKDTKGRNGWTVGANDVERYDKLERFQLPGWARCFVRIVDAIVDEGKSPYATAEVTREHALGVLRECTQEKTD